MELDITSKIKGVKILNKSFRDKDTGETINYKQLQIEFVINGNRREMPFKLGADRALVLESVPEPDANLNI